MFKDVVCLGTSPSLNPLSKISSVPNRARAIDGQGEREKERKRERERDQQEKERIGWERPSWCGGFPAEGFFTWLSPLISLTMTTEADLADPHKEQMSEGERQREKRKRERERENTHT